MADGKTANGVGSTVAPWIGSRGDSGSTLGVVPAGIVAERGIEASAFGSVRASVVTALPDVGMMNLVLGATEPGAVAEGHLAAADEKVRSRQVASYVPVRHGLPEAEPAKRWLSGHGFAPAYAWIKFATPTCPPRFGAPEEAYLRPNWQRPA